MDPVLTQTTDRPPRRTALVASELRRYDIDVAALSETRLASEGSLVEVGEGYTFFWKGRPDTEHRIHGVGFAIKSTFLRKLPVTPVGISERLMSMRVPLVKNRYVTLISCYAPTLTSSEDSKDQFYEELDNLLSDAPQNDKIIILGDFNARVGSNYNVWHRIIGRHGVGKENANGIRLLNLCALHNLAITKTLFQLHQAENNMDAPTL